MTAPTDFFEPRVLVALGLLVLLPLIGFLGLRIAPEIRRRYRLRRRFPRPARVDRNLIVIGGGAAGLVASAIAAALGARVTLVEAERMGGDCLYTGCVPSKTLLAVARRIHEARTLATHGFARLDLTTDFAAVMAQVHAAIAAIAPHDSPARYAALGVECVHGRARIVSPYAVEVDGRRLTARAIVLATGARPTVPPLPGLDTVAYLTSDSLWTLETLPTDLLVLGGGPIGCELAQAFARLGSRVTLIEQAPRLLPREDAAVGDLLAAVLREEGVTIHLAATARAVRATAHGGTLELELPAGARRTLSFAHLLVAVGRTPNRAGYGLEELGLVVPGQDGLVVDAALRTRVPSIYACGDVVGPYQFTHVASHQAAHAAINALFGSPLKRFAVDYRHVPWCVFTDPEVARAGLNADQARARGLRFEITHFPLRRLDRAVAEDQTRGYVEVLTPPRSDRILGVTVVGAHAGEVIAEFVLAMRHGLGLGKILATVHAYPTFAEAARSTAAEWRRAHAPPWLLPLLERFHRWRRDGRTGRA